MTNRERLLTDLLREYKIKPSVAGEPKEKPGPMRSSILSELEGRLSEERESIRNAREKLFLKNQELRETRSPEKKNR